MVVGMTLPCKCDPSADPWGNPSIVPTKLAGVKMAAAGWDHNVALLTNGTVTAWGYNGVEWGWNLTNVPSGLSNVISVVAAAQHSVALNADGTVVAWGYSPSGETNVPAGLSNVVAVAAGDAHNLALQRDGTAATLGEHTFVLYHLASL